MITLRNIRKNYGEHTVLNDISLTIHPGEVFGLLGTNGAGKTTLMNILCGQIAPSSGEVRLNTLLPTSSDAKRLIGIAPQTLALYPTLTVRDNLRFFAQIYALPDDRIDTTLTAVALQDRLNDRVASLSGGMQRRLNLAFPLIFAAFFGSVYNRADSRPHIELGILDADNMEQSRNLIKQLSEHDSIKIVSIANQDENAYHLAVKRQQIAAYLHIPAGFLTQYVQLFSQKAPSVTLVVDPKQPEVAMILTGILKELASARFANVFNVENVRSALPHDTPSPILDSVHMLSDALQTSQQGGMPSFNPIDVVNKPLALGRDTPDSGFVFILPQAAIWICIGLVTAFVAFIGIEATSGNLLRLSRSPFGKVQFLLAKGFAVFFAQIALIAVFYVITWCMINFSFNALALLLSVLATAFAFTGIMLGFAAFIDSQSRSAGSLVNAVLLLAGMIGGAMIPITFMPKWMLAISQFSPVYHVIFALEGATWRGLSLSALTLSLSILFVIGALGLSISLAKFRYVQGER